MTRERKSSPVDPLEISTDQERRKVFLRYVNRAWLLLGIVSLATLPIFPEQRGEFIFLIVVTFPTYLIIRSINLSGRTRLAGVIFTLAVNFGFYGLFLVLVGQLGAYKAFETQISVWMLMGLAVLFAGALVDKRAAPVLAALNSTLLIGTRLMIAPGSDPRPSALVFWWMMALTSWLYEGTLHEALKRSWVEVMERKQAHKAIQEAELKYRTLVEHLPVVLYTSELGANGVWHYVSPQIEHLLGFTPDEWMADPGLWHRQVHPSDRERVMELERQTLAQQESFEGEYRILTRDGRFIWVRDSAHILLPQGDHAPIVQGLLMDITESKQAQASIAMLALRYETLLHTASDGIHVLDDQGYVVEANTAFCSMLGYTREELLQLNVASWDMQWSGNELLAKIGELITHPAVFETLHRRKDGIIRNVEINGVGIVLDDGRNYLYASARDITERKQAEEALRESESLLREAQVVADMGSYVLDFNSGMWKSSAILDKLFGIDDAYVRSVEGWSNLIHPDHRQQMTDYFTNEVMGKRIRFDREYKIIRKNDAVERWVHGLGSLEVDAQNRLVKMHGVIQDITERKQAEEALSENQQFLTLVLDTMPGFLFWKDRNSNFMGCNSRFAKAAGLNQPSEIFGKSDYELAWLREEADSFVNDDREVMESDTPKYHIIEPQLQADGKHAWLDTSKIPLHDIQGNVVGVLGTYEDITERKHTEDEMHQRLIELETLYESGLAINQLLDPREIGQKVIELLEQQLSWHHTTIRLYDPQDESLKLLAFNQPGLKSEVERREVEERFNTLIASTSQGMSGWAVRHKQVIRSSDLRNDPRYVDTYPGLQSGLYVPMKLGKRVIGVISIESEQLNAFNAADERLAATLANQAASALENARLFEAERKQREVSDALRDALSAGASMNISLDFETILDRLLEALERVVPFEGGCIMLVQPEKQKISIAKMRGYNKLNKQLMDNISKFSFDIASVENLRWVLNNKQPLVIPDIEQYSGWIRIPESSFTRSWAGAPIIVNDEVIALFSLDSDKPNFFTNEHVELMRAFTGQASLALQNARLFKQTERRFQEFASLYETSKALSADNELNTLLKNIVEHAATLLNAGSGAMYLYNRTNDNLEIVVTTTPAIPIGTILRLGEGVAGRVAQTHQPMRVENYSTWEGRSHIYDGILFHAVLEVPMLFGGDLIGVLTVAEMEDTNRTFTESDEHLLSLFAAQAAGVLHSARLREETARRAREFASLYETSNALSVENELNIMLQVIVEHARKLLDSASSGMYLYLSATNELELAVDTTSYELLGTRLQLGEGVAGRVAQTRRSLRVDDYSTWEGRSLQYEGDPIRAVLEVPMLYGGELIGVLTADEINDSKRKFTEDDERLLSLFASQAAGVIHSARLHEQTARRLDQLQSLHTIDRAISSSFDLRPILNTVISQTISQLGVDAVDVLLFHPHLQTLEYIAGQGFHTRAIEQTHLRLGEGQAGHAAFERRIIHIPNLPETEDNFVSLFVLDEGFLEYYAVPLIAKGEIKGVLEVFHRASLPRDPEWLDFLETLAGQAAITIDQTQLFEDLQRANLELIIAYDATIEGWARAMDLRDKETENHTRRVTEMTLSLAKALDIKDSETLHIRRGALLHDIGKMGVPDNILLKEGELTEEEWILMRRHPQFSYEMLQPIKYLQQSLDIPYSHHEKWDGTGYPRGLKGEQIPLAARIFAIVDVWDALTSDRPYRKGWSKQKALKHIREQSGKHFDPRVVEAFLELFGNEKS